MEQLQFGGKASAEVTQSGLNYGQLKTRGIFHCELIEQNGAVKSRWSSKNNLTNQGLEYILDVLFSTKAKIDIWYVGIYTGQSGTISDLTGASVGTSGGLAEFSTYLGARRRCYLRRTQRTISNILDRAEFGITSNGTITGAFIVDKSTGTPDTLLSVADFGNNSRTVQNGDTLRVTYELSVSN